MSSEAGPSTKTTKQKPKKVVNPETEPVPLSKETIESEDESNEDDESSVDSENLEHVEPKRKPEDTGKQKKNSKALP